MLQIGLALKPKVQVKSVQGVPSYTIDDETKSKFGFSGCIHKRRSLLPDIPGSNSGGHQSNLRAGCPSPARSNMVPRFTGIFRNNKELM